jgi:serine/threonine-protein kinase
VKRCPSCALDNQPDAVFCVRCGFSLAGVSANPPAVNGGGGRYLPEGAVVDGKYRIEKILGEGGMGVVYLAKDVHTETPVVVKSIRFEYSDNPEFRARTLAEGRALARIDHPNVVRLNAVVVEPAALYLVMQFIDGEPLDHMIERHVASRTAMPIPYALSIFRMVLRGVGAAHAEGLIHRDLKPANILIRKKDGVAKVTDFGIAKVEEDAKAGRGVTKGIIGSLPYMAPEQVRGQRDLDKRVDIYALGILLFELVMGRPPFDAPSDYELMRMHAEAPLPSVSAQRPDAPAYIDEILNRACAKDRDQRFASTDEFLAAIDHAEGHGGPRHTAPITQLRVATEIPPAPFTSQAPGVLSGPPPSPSGPPPPVHVPRASGPPVPQHIGVTGEGTSLPNGPRHGSRRGGAWIWYAVLGVAVVGGGGATAIYFGSSPEPAKTGDAPRVVDAARPHDAGPSAPVEAAAAPSPLAALAGRWRSTSGRDFAAVTEGDALEFRIVQASQHARQGYEDGEVRFKLLPVAGTTGEFAVEDHLRPAPLPGFEYDAKAARDTCVGVWTAAKGKKLLAQFDGASQLTVDFVQVRTGPERFKTQGKRVTGCVDLTAAPAEPIESRLVRVP